MTQALTRWGFDTPRLAFAARTALAVCLAFLLAWLFGLEHPQWAGMTVWAASQPLRGQLLEKSLFRLAGTISGTIVGVLLVLAMTIHPALLVVGLALWVALCTGIGNLQRGFVAYGTVLAGYTAAMVALLDTAHPDHVLYLGLDRLATVLTGVVVATAVGYAFAPRADKAGLHRKMAELVADLLTHVTDPAPKAGADVALLARLAELDEGLDTHAAGRLRTHQRMRAARSVLLAAMSVLLHHHDGWRPAARDRAALREAAQLLRQGQPAAADRIFADLLADQPDSADMRRLISALQQALARWNDLPEPQTTPLPDAAFPVILHRDLIGAREAALRAGGLLLLFGTIWQVSGFAAGAYLLLGLSVMISLFSTFENPAHFMRNVALGQMLGVLGALAARWLVWPLAGDELGLVLLTLPFILLGPLLVGHRRTVLVSFDYNMVLLLMLHPVWPLTGSFPASLAAGIAVIAAPVAAMGAYRWIYPVTAKRRLTALTQAMLHDVTAAAAMAAETQGDGPASVDLLHWRARMYHRILRLLRLSRNVPGLEAQALQTGATMLKLGQAVARCHGLLADPATPPALRRSALVALARLQALPSRPQRAEHAMARLAQRLTGEGREVMNHAAAGLGALPLQEPRAGAVNTP